MIFGQIERPSSTNKEIKTNKRTVKTHTETQEITKIFYAKMETIH